MGFAFSLNLFESSWFNIIHVRKKNPLKPVHHLTINGLHERCCWLICSLFILSLFIIHCVEDVVGGFRRTGQHGRPHGSQPDEGWPQARHLRRQQEACRAVQSEQHEHATTSIFYVF